MAKVLEKNTELFLFAINGIDLQLLFAKVRDDSKIEVEMV